MASRKATKASAIELYPYQRAWVQDASRFKLGVWARQAGKSFAASLEAVLDAAETGSLWVLLSRGERQSLELMEKVRAHARAYNIALKSLDSTFRGDATFKMLEVRLPNGGRVIGLPANPDTARGFSGNVLLDEFAFHADSREIWRALYPTITRGYKLRVISTPNGRSGMFYELWSAGESFSRHRVTIYDAVAAGLSVDIEELRQSLRDPDAWAQEYECEFIDEATSLVTYEMISACEADCLWSDGILRSNAGLYLGMDIGRRRDLSVVVLVERLGDVLWVRRIEEMVKAPFNYQRDVLFSYLPHVRRACIDATGLGMQLAEEAQQRFGGHKVESITFTQAVKEELAMTMLRAFQDRKIRIPPDRQFREDLHSVRKYVTAAGNVRYDAERTEGAGHADRFWALALALHAGAQRGWTAEYRTVRPRDYSGAVKRWMETAYG